MPINFVALDRKFNALKNRDLNAIVAKQISFPFLPAPYTKADLAAYVKKFIDLFRQIRVNNYTDQQITTFIANHRAALGAADRAIADNIINNVDAGNDGTSVSSSAAYDRIMAITIYKFITSPGT